MTVLFADIETYCETPIKSGHHRYAERAEVLLFAWAFGDGPVTVWDMTTGDFTPGDIQALIGRAAVSCWHNSAFDRTVLRHGAVTIPLEKIEDTMVLALQHSLPAALGALCDVLGVEADKAKDKDGKKLIQLFSKPRPKNTKLRRATRETHPDEWRRFIEYARLDVDAMRAVYRRLPRWNDSDSERLLWRLDQGVNDLGVAVDLELARSALRAFERTSRSLAARAAVLTGGTVSSTTQRDALLGVLRDRCGIDLPDMTGDTVKRLLSGDLPPLARELLEIRQQAAATSPAKYKALTDAASSDGRLRGTIQFCGASRTGRDAGRIFQPQNLPRTPDWFDGDVQEMTVAAFKADAEDVLWENISDRCAWAVRGCLVAAPGKKLAIADLSNIEGRVLAWLAGEEWKIEAFKAYDRGEGHDLYKVTAGRILGKDPGDVTKDERGLQGKVPELACLGPLTRVITNNGVKPIIEVTAEDLLWDGEAWVRNTGLVSRGRKQVLSVQGVQMTPDHLVLCGETWLSAQMVATYPNCLDLASETGSESLKSLDSISAREGVCAPFSSNARAEWGRTAPTSTTSAEGPRPGVMLAPSGKQASGRSSGSATRPSAPTTATDDGYATASRPVSTGATTLTTRRTLTTGGAASMSTNLGELTEPRTSRISSRWTAGIGLNSNSTGLMSTGATSRAISASSGSEPTATTCAVSETCKPASLIWSNVYDIANAGPRNRFTILTDDGALVVHNCGYGGSLGAFRKMGGPVVDAMSDARVSGIVQDWRQQHPATKRLWYSVEGAVRDAVRAPDQTIELRGGLLRIGMADGPDGALYLRIRLPSGRYLCYRKMHIDDGGNLRYEGMNQYTRKWEWLETYYGKLVENIVQAIARDVFMAGMRRAILSNYPVVLRVHDELVCEVPDDPAYSHERLAEMMATNPGWAIGLPLAAEGFTAYRYRK